MKTKSILIVISLICSIVLIFYSITKPTKDTFSYEARVDENWSIPIKLPSESYDLSIKNNNIASLLYRNYIFFKSAKEKSIFTFNLDNQEWKQHNINQVIEEIYFTEKSSFFVAKISNSYKLFEFILRNNEIIEIKEILSIKEKDLLPHSFDNINFRANIEFRNNIFEDNNRLVFPFVIRVLPNNAKGNDFLLVRGLRINLINFTFDFVDFQSTEHFSNSTDFSFPNLKKFIVWNSSNRLYFSLLDENYKLGSPELITPKYVSVVNFGKDFINTDKHFHCSWRDFSNDQKGRFGSQVDNNHGIYYRKRDLITNTWNDSVYISKGIKYNFNPKIAISNNIVTIFWGVSDDNIEANSSPKEIYYSLSKDYGNTWSAPLKVTNTFSKERIRNNYQQVILYNNKIFLFYNCTKYKNYSEGAFYVQTKDLI